MEFKNYKFALLGQPVIVSPLDETLEKLLVILPNLMTPTELLEQWPELIEEVKGKDTMEISGMILRALVTSALDIKGDQLWERTWNVTSSLRTIGGGFFDNEITTAYRFTVSMTLQSKDQVLGGIAGSWVYNNYAACQEYMADSKGIYAKLEKINQLFPVVEEL